MKFHTSFIGLILVFLLVVSGCSVQNKDKMHSSKVVGDIQKMNPINDEFLVEKHEDYAEMLRVEKGLSKEEADEETYRVQLHEVAIINRAIDVGIKVSEEEALQEANKTRQMLKEVEGVENAEVALTKTQETIEKLGISEDEYWNKFVINSFIQSLMKEKLIEYERIENPEMNWNERQEEIIEEFKSNESLQINEFKKEIGLN
ncbi:hypothetical protein RJD24_08010 [Bacillaceae bacterium IKA-2]|nr:hypothetical protein RJD24_08010 [Bacillaceae bacterium IKA-2]